MNGYRKLIAGLIAVVATFPIAYWVVSTDSMADEIPDLQLAIKKINERVEVHITRRRYQDCSERCVQPIECPPDNMPLPASRCK